MSATILISTGARLHFGFFAHGPASGTSYGGVGLMVDSPGFVLAASGYDPDRPAPTPPGQPMIENGVDEVRCNLKAAASAGERDPFAGPPPVLWPDLTARALKFVRLYRMRSTHGNRPPLHCEIEIWSAIPAHQGLGSGTQLGMAVAHALARLADEPDIDPLKVARRVGRGQRSAIGIHGFASGGFLMDGGKIHEELIGHLEKRVDVPSDWRFLLVAPPGQAAGLSGRDESEALKQLPATSSEMTERLWGLAGSEMVPALTAADCERFSAALFEFGRTVGDYFRPVQGGTYASPAAAALVDWIQSRGFRGVAQSSWGPTLAVCCPDQASAESLREQLRADSQWQAIHTRIVRPLNAGAKVQSITSGETP
jgi:beta-RFAP synthase